MITAASQHLQRSWSVAFWQRSWSDDAVVDQLHVVPCCIHFFDELQQVEAFAGGVSDGSLPTLGSATASTTSWSWFTRGAADCSWWVLFDYSWNLNWMPMTYDTLWHLLTSYDLWTYDSMMIRSIVSKALLLTPRRPWFLVQHLGLDGDFSVVRLRWRATRLNQFAESTGDFGHL